MGEAVEAARLMSTPQGQVRALPSAGALLVVDFPDRVDKIRKLVEQLEAAARGLTQPGAPGGGPRQLEVAYFRTHYVEAVTAGQALDVVLSTDGRVATIDDEDRLLVVDYPEHLAMVRAVLARIDRPRPQVNIKALIYDIGLSDAEELGINWDGITNGTIVDGVATSDGTGLRFQSQTKAPFDATSTGGSFTFYNISSSVNIQAIVLALQEAEDSRLLADPNVTVMDNEQANIESVQEIPFQQLTQTGAGGNIGTTAFKPVGIKLDVTPKIANDHTIDMTVVPEFSRLTGFTPGDNQPIIDTRKATTRVRVANGQTLMIAGLRQRNDVGDFDGIPLLKDVRFVGHLFRSRSTQIEESELVVFITPEIVGFSDPLGERDQLSADTIRCRLDHIPAAEGCPSCGPCASPGHPAHGYGGTTYQATEPVAAPEPAPAEAEGEAPELNPPTLAPQPETVPSLPEAVEKPSFQDTPAERPVARAAGTPTAGLNYPDLAVNRVRRLPPVGGNVAAEADAPASRLSPSAFADAVAPERAMRVAYESRFRAKGGLGRRTGVRGGERWGRSRGIRRGGVPGRRTAGAGTACSSGDSERVVRIMRPCAMWRNTARHLRRRSTASGELRFKRTRVSVEPSAQGVAMRSRILLAAGVATATLLTSGCGEQSPPASVESPPPTPLAAAAARAQDLNAATESARVAEEKAPEQATAAVETEVAYEPPFPNREDLFSPPKHMNNVARATGERSAESVVLMGFANLDRPRAVLAIDGIVTPLAHDEEANGVKVIAISPPEAVLQRGRSRWTASIQ